MSYRQVSSLLNEARAALQADLAEAVATQQWDSAATLVDVARQLEALSDLLAPHIEERSLQRVVTLSRNSARRWDYPRFSVDGDRLKKVGRAKQPNAQEYVHEMTRDQFEDVTGWFAANVDRGQRAFVARVAEHDLENSVPSYLVYLAIAALRKTGILIQTKRGTYEISPSAPTPPSEWWEALIQTLARKEVAPTTDDPNASQTDS